MENIKTAEDVLRKSFDKNVRGMYSNKLSFDMAKGAKGIGYDWVYEAMEEFTSLQSFKDKEEIERLNTLIGNAKKVFDINTETFQKTILDKNFEIINLKQRIDDLEEMLRRSIGGLC